MAFLGTFTLPEPQNWFPPPHTRSVRWRRIQYQGVPPRRDRQGEANPVACPLCGFTFIPKHRTRQAVWDHCHRCGEFRGWLCNRCNGRLGRFTGFRFKRPRWFLRAQGYIRAHLEECRAGNLSRRARGPEGPCYTRGVVSLDARKGMHVGTQKRL